MAMDFPSGPTVGQIVSLGGNQYIWDGTAWNIIPQQAPAALSDLPPANPAVGQFWWRATNGQLYVYVNDGNSSQWVQAAGQGITPNKWELIADLTLAAVANYPITDLSWVKRLRISGSFAMSTSAFLAVQFSLDNGATWKAGATDYAYQRTVASGAVITPSAANNGSMPLTVSNDVGFRGPVWATIEDFNLAGNTATGLAKSGQLAAGNMQLVEYFNKTNFNGPCNALRLLPSAGTLTGSILIEGVRG